MWIFLALIVVGLAIVWVVYPILRPPMPPFSQTEATRRQRIADLEAQKDSVLQAIKDLEFDHRAGKVSAEDFQNFSARLKMEAAHILKQLDALRTESDSALSEALESEITALRQARRAETAEIAVVASSNATLDDDLEAEIQRARLSSAAKVTVCPRCRYRARPGDRFCAQCGEPLPPA